LIPFLGVLAANAKLRARVVPQGPNRGGLLRFIAAIVESVVIERIVTQPGIQRELLDSRAIDLWRKAVARTSGSHPLTFAVFR